MTPPIELCCQCREATGRAGRGEDSIYAADGTPAELGPLCPTCYETLTNESEIERLAAEVRRLQAEVTALRLYAPRPSRSAVRQGAADRSDALASVGNDRRDGRGICATCGSAGCGGGAE